MARKKAEEGVSGTCKFRESASWIRTGHYETPDYSRPLLEIPPEARERMMGRLIFLYGEVEAKKRMPELERILKVYYAHKPPEMIERERGFDPTNRFTEKDVVLVTYGDLLLREGVSPLAGMVHFIDTMRRQRPIFSTLHILPFFPYSSDRGFSVVDFRAVDPKLGSWQDIEEIGKRFQLMFDGVLNHASAESMPFREMLNGNPFYRDVVIAYSSPEELTPEQRKIIVRPRTSDILTEFQSIDGPIWVWTTFSQDQVDLNYKNPGVLLWAIETLLLYVRKGADIVRLDAVTYLWSEPGTPSVHLEQTHQIIKLFRDVLTVVAPGVALITETNVPHKDNVSYFGNGDDEAQMVYNFSLPPLVLHAFYREDTTALSTWAMSLEYPSETTTFFNILDTHDGIGVMGVRDILPREEIQFMIQRAREHGAFISYRTGDDGNDEPYEINSTWFSALNRDNSDEEISFQVKRFVAARSIALALKGVPGIYFHGLIGTRNDVEAVLLTKSKRDINRRVIYEEALLKDLTDPYSKLSHITRQLGRILEIRVRQCAFHPNGDQRVLMISPEIFAVLRTCPDCGQHILTLTNVCNRENRIQIPLADIGISETHWYDLVNKGGWMAKDQKLAMVLQPYDVVWLIPFAELEKSIES